VDVGGIALKLQCLETCPSEQTSVCGCEIPKALGHILAPITSSWRFHVRHLALELADGLM
jgi:hypothetical protein